MLPLIAYHFFRAQWAFQHLRGERLRQYQSNRARRIANHAVAHSPFYRHHFVGRHGDVGDFPTVDKAMMMAHFGDFNTLGITENEAFAVALQAERDRDFAPALRGNITAGLSSGTSGHRGAFLVSPAETATWAGTVLGRVLHGLPRPGYRVAFFLRSNSNLYERVNGRVQFRYFDLMTPPLQAIAALNVYAPNLLVAPPSLLLVLADAVRRGLLTSRPERIVSVAETLEPRDKAVLEDVFGVAVGQVYQCTEGFLAATCARGRLHVNDDLVTVQWEPLADGRVTPIVTDLWRRVQPIIRYRLGDVLTLSNAACPCGSGFQVIESVAGRCDDACFFASTTGQLRRVYPDTVRRMVLIAHQGITDYAAVQDAPGELRVHITIAEGTDFGAVEHAVRESVAEVLAGYDSRTSRVTVVDGLPPTAPGAKHRRVIRRCESPPESAIK